MPDQPKRSASYTLLTRAMHQCALEQPGIAEHHGFFTAREGYPMHGRVVVLQDAVHAHCVLVAHDIEKVLLELVEKSGSDLDAINTWNLCDLLSDDVLANLRQAVLRRQQRRTDHVDPAAHRP